MKIAPIRRSAIDKKHGESCDFFDMRIDRNGIWFHKGAPIKRMAMVKLFATVLNKHSDGTFWLTTPIEHGRIEVEDAPFIAVELFQKGAGRSQEIDFRTNVNDMISLGPSHSLRVDQNIHTGEPAPYISIGRGLEAKLNRSVFYSLVELGETTMHQPDTESYGVWSRGIWFPIGKV